MSRKFFTKASPRAANGIRKLYENSGYEVRALLQHDGSVTVVAMKDEAAPRRVEAARRTTA